MLFVVEDMVVLLASSGPDCGTAVAVMVIDFREEDGALVVVLLLLGVVMVVPSEKESEMCWCWD